MDLNVVMKLGELQAPPDVVVALALDRKGLSASYQSAPGEPSRGFHGGEGIPTWGDNERA